MSNYNKLVRLLGVRAFFNGLCFFSPVSLLVRTAAGVSVSEFFLLQALLSLVTLLTELPAGMLTDKLGYSAVAMLAEYVLAHANRARRRGLFALFLALEGAGMVLFGATDAIFMTLPLMLVLPFLHDVPSYILEEAQNEAVDAAGQAEKRAQLLNMFNMGSCAAEVFFLVGSGLVSGAGSALCFISLGAFFLAASALALTPPLRPRR